MEDKMEIAVAEASEADIRPEQEAVIITERIKANGRAAVSAVCNIGKDLRRMKVENLFTYLGYEDFEDYAEKEFAIKKRQAYLYISVYEKLGEEFLQSNAQLGITRLSLLSSANPEDRAEILENNNVAGMTTKELEELIDKYKQQGEQLSLLEDENAKLKEESELDRKKQENANAAAQSFKAECKRRAKEQQRLEDRVEVLEQKIKENAATITDLEATIEDYEKSPKDIQVAEKEIIKEVVKEVPDKAMKAELDEKTKELNAANAENMLREQTINRMKKEIEELKKAAEKPVESSDKSSFKTAYASAYKEITGLIELIRSAGDEKTVFIERTEALIKALADKLEEVKK